MCVKVKVTVRGDRVRQCGELLSTNVHFLFPLELFRARLTLKR
jgi:hypothetical protein